MKGKICLLLAVAALCGLGGVSSRIDASAEQTAQELRYGYTMLSQNEQYVYQQLQQGLSGEVLQEEIILDQAKNISVEQTKRAFSVFSYDYPEYFWVGNNYTYRYLGEEGTSTQKVVSLQVENTMEGQNLILARRALQERIDAILADMPQGDNYDKALYLHDTLAQNVTYEMVGHHQTAYGALVDGKAVCAGYAKAYQLLLQSAGIDGCAITGNSVDPTTNQQVAHAWNLVWLDEDTCVYTDVTWDDQQGELYHYYFNLSKAEMAVDHDVDTDIYTLPACSHDEQSYFDANQKTMQYTDSAAEAALLFGPAYTAKSGQIARTAVVYYPDEDLPTWLTENAQSLYIALGGGAGAYAYEMGCLGKEYHITFTGQFSLGTYRVSFSYTGMTTVGETLQYVSKGQPIKPVTFIVERGRVFEEKYNMQPINGLTLVRINEREVVVSGTPTADCFVSLPSPSTIITAVPSPMGIFEARGEDCGILRGLNIGDFYSFDQVNWKEVETQPMELNNLTACTLYIWRKGGLTMIDVYQTIEIGQQETENVRFARPTNKHPYGSIKTTTEYEYSKDLEMWNTCFGELTDLNPGIYYVRKRATGSTLASKTQMIDLSYRGEAKGGCSSVLPLSSAACILLPCGIAFLAKKRKRK